jgi:PPOX class probable F420-dependent enzyme
MIHLNQTRAVILRLPIALAMLMLTAVAARADVSARDTSAMANANLIYIATVRKDGNQSRNTPVWFIMTKDNALLIQTSPTSWKAKRIRRGSPALIWIGKGDGPAFIGKAEILTDKDSQQAIIDGIPRKYWMARMGFAKPSQQKFDDGKIVVIKITPVRDLPDGFTSQPGTPAPPLEAK